MIGLSVRGYNWFSESVVNPLANLRLIKPALAGLEAISNKINSAAFKTYKDIGLKPVMFLGAIQKFYYGEAVFNNMTFRGLNALIKKAAEGATIAKMWVCVPDFLGTLPGIIKSFTKIEKSEDLKRKFLNINGIEERTFQLSPTETVYSRISKAVGLVFAFGDSVGFIKHHVGVPKHVERITPWLFASTGIYVGIQGMYQEYRVRQMGGFSDLHFSENYLSWSNLALSASSFFFGAVGLASVVLGDKIKNYPLLSRCQFIGNCAMNTMPIVQFACGWLRDSYNVTDSKNKNN